MAIAMDTRAFSSGNNRTYYKITSWKKRDTIVLLVSLIAIIILLYITIHFGLFKFSLSMNKRGI
ncbi:hypothetical protein [Miniphocaeibacter massiliensis]|uniref:hypothetical protein n=1 Tax=Miniphocaeibacter massiliensis TaxID=2041841 RepID=UPI000C1BC935|nr:hypothetical protein [Miniphocaeibacter massiliensis]